MAATGCFSPAVTRGAHAIVPQQADDTSSIWVYLSTDNADMDGVYRCVDANNHVVCRKATLTQ